MNDRGCVVCCVVGSRALLGPARWAAEHALGTAPAQVRCAMIATRLAPNSPLTRVLFPTLFPRLILGFFRDAGAVVSRNAAVTSR